MAIQKLANELAKEEQEHVMLFETASARWDVHSHISHRVEMPSSNKEYSAMIKMPELSEFLDEESVLSYAMSREKIAMRQYEGLAKRSVPRPLKDLFVYLAREEVRHFYGLESRLREIDKA